MKVTKVNKKGYTMNKENRKPSINQEIKEKSLLKAKQIILDKGDLNNSKTQRRLQKIESQIAALRRS